MIWCAIAVLCAHTVVVVEGASQDEDAHTRRFLVEHALRPGDWSQRGSVSLDFERDVVVFDEYELKPADLESLNSLRSSDDPYQVRVTAEGSSQPIFTSVQPCRFRVRQGKIEDHFVFHADLWGHVRSIDYYPRMAPERMEKRSCVSNAALDSPSQNGVTALKSTGRIVLPSRGSSPEIIEKATKAAGGKQEQTFFQKYWWMLGLGGFFLVVQLLNNPEIQQAAAAQQAASRR